MEAHRFTGHFFTGAGPAWENPGAAYDGDGETLFRPTGRQCFFKFAVPESAANDLMFRIKTADACPPEGYVFRLAYGDEHSQTDICGGITFVPAANETFNVPFSYTVEDVERIKAHCGSLLFGLKTGGDTAAGSMYEIEWLSPANGLWAGEKNAGTVYAGNTPAKAVYLGTDQIM